MSWNLTSCKHECPVCGYPLLGVLPGTCHLGDAFGPRVHENSITISEQMTLATSWWEHDIPKIIISVLNRYWTSQPESEHYFSVKASIY